jgi:photosystem II stability/assembly factor-like uncharacterized protein
MKHSESSIGKQFSLQASVFQRTIIAFLFILSPLPPAFGQQGWSRVNTIQKSGQPATINAVAFDGDIIWVVGADGLIMRSLDDGKTFEEVLIKTTDGLNDVFIRKESVWMVGDKGTIIYSTDGGQSFAKRIFEPQQRASSNSQNRFLDLYSIEFADKERGFIVGDEGLILATTDGGRSWYEQKSGVQEQLFHLSFRGRDGWAVGTKGTILHTSNGGNNWYPQRSGTDKDLNRIFLITEKTGLISGDNGTLLRTENGGATWEQVGLKVGEPLFGISFIDKKTGWVVGYQGRVVRTYDGGRSWVDQASTTEADLFSVSFRENRGYAIGRDGLVMRYFERR